MVGLPRTRGDGPRSSSLALRSPGASPHTRGWTPCWEPRPQTGRGFPAHAGMDPSASECSVLPRTASPHTRGWTAAVRELAPGIGGFPAHAGMDRERRATESRRSGLPRTRGDGPRTNANSPSLATASPHTRGWTLLGEVDELPQVGFPAHAGMDPSPAPGRCRRPGLPRTRGDGPVSGRGAGSCAGASPHTRGWTGVGAGENADGSGFPAHAGMDPGRAGSLTSQSRLPRTRGDGPWAGDGGAADAGASPHTRGWTQLDAKVPARVRGFPAHAGMDPVRLRYPAVALGLPRTRGDGPATY